MSMKKFALVAILTALVIHPVAADEWDDSGSGSNEVSISVSPSRNVNAGQLVSIVGKAPDDKFKEVNLMVKEDEEFFHLEREEDCSNTPCDLKYSVSRKGKTLKFYVEAVPNDDSRDAVQSETVSVTWKEPDVDTSPVAEQILGPMSTGSNPHSTTPSFKFRYSDDSDQLTYKLYLDNDQTPKSNPVSGFPIVETAEPGENVQIDLASEGITLEEGTDYKWLVEVSDGKNPAVSSRKYSFTTKRTTDTSPVAETIKGPMGEGKSTKPSFRFKYSDDSDQLTYKLYLDNDDTPLKNPLPSFPIKRTVKPGKTVKIDFSDKGITLDDGKDYEWQLTVSDGINPPVRTREYNLVTKSDINRAPLFEKVKGPQGNSVSLFPAFRFKASDDGRKLDYTLHIDNDDTPFKSPEYRLDLKNRPEGVLQTLNISERNEKLDYSTTYSWGVSAEDEEGSTVESKGGTFTTKSERKTADLRISDWGHKKLSNRRVKLFVELNRKPERGWCKWSEESISSQDSNYMNEKGEKRWEITKKFSKGSHTVYYQCYKWGEPITEKKKTSFTIESDEDDGSEPPSDEPDIGNKPPRANLEVSPRFGDSGTKFSFDASGSSDSDGHVDEYKWDFDGDGHFERTTTSSDHDPDVQEKRIYGSGTFRARVKVVDDDGRSDTAEDSYRVRQHDDFEPPSNRVPSVSLLSPDNGEVGVSTSPLLSWRVSDPDDGVMSDVDLFVERKDFTGDKPWDKGREISVSRQVGQGSRVVGGLRPDTVYVWGVEADDGEDSRRSAVFDFRTRDSGLDPSPQPPSNRRPSVSLLSPDNGEAGVSTSPVFEWALSDPDDGVMSDVDLFVERKDFTGDKPWDKGRKVSVSRYTGRSSITVTGLDPDTVYVWGVEADDGEDSRRSAVFDFRTRESQAPSPTPPPSGRCDISVSDLDISKSQLDPGESTRATIDVENTGDPQRLQVTFKVDGLTVREDDVNIEGSRTFNKQLSLQSDGQVRAVVESLGGSCGSRTLATRTDFIDVTGDSETGLDANLDVEVEDEDGRNLDAYVEVDGPEDDTQRTFSDGRVDFDLEPGEYDVEAYKDGYSTEEEEVDLESGEDEDINLELDRLVDRIQLMEARVPAEVCRGNTLSTDIRVRNNGLEDTLTFRVRSSGSIVTKQVNVPAHSTVSRTLTISSFDSEGTTDVDITVRNSETKQITKTVEGVECDGAGNTNAEGISLDLSSDQVTVGSSVEVTGFVDGDRGATVDVRVGSENVARTSSNGRGYYRAVFQPQEVGQQTVKVQTGERSAFTRLMVLPTVNVGSVSAPDKTFRSEVFDICADVNSQVDPLVTLIKDGERLDSKTASGEVCFETEASETGDHNYRVLASAYGVQSSASRTVDVLERGSEVESFPGKITTVRSGDGLVKVDLYNTGEDSRTYDISVSGVSETWFETTDRSVELVKGERDTVYFYVTPEAEGTFISEIEVSRNGEEVFSRSVTVSSGGTSQKQKTSLIGTISSLIRI